MRLMVILSQNNRSNAELQARRQERVPVVLEDNNPNHTESVPETRNRGRKVMGRSELDFYFRRILSFTSSKSVKLFATSINFELVLLLNPATSTIVPLNLR